jgi:hypothetical protein
MIHLPRRHFFQSRNEKHYNKRSRAMGGPIYLDGMIPEFIRGEVTPQHKIQESIDALNAAITRLDNIINEMKEQTNGTRD